MADFMEAVKIVLANEGGLVNSSTDPGGVTNFGISLRWYKETVSQEATAEDIISLTQDAAIALYKKYFWDNHPYENINSQPLANYIFDMSVNMGASVAHKISQRTIWTVEGYNSLIDDGILGQITLSKINLYDIRLILPIQSERAGYYRLIASSEAFAKDDLTGWLNRAYKQYV